MKSKRGVIGSFMVSFIATIIIVLILVGFVLMSSLVKVVSKADAGLVIHDESMVGINDGIGYMNNYAKLIEARSKVGTYLSLDQSLLEVGYEK